MKLKAGGGKFSHLFKTHFGLSPCEEDYVLERPDLHEES